METHDNRLVHILDFFFQFKLEFVFESRNTLSMFYL